MDIQELRELVNPVFNTAKSCVQLDAAAGDEDSQRLLDALGFDPFGARSSDKPIPKEMAEQLKKLTPAFTIVVESRFQSMNQLVESRKDRTIVDLPCGYTARGIRLSRQGRTYFGFDLPAVAHDMGPAVESIIGKNEAIAYHAVDATNYNSLKAAFAEDDHDLLITTEGLLMYFDQHELEEVFANIHRLLQEQGGSWVIADRAYFHHDKEVVAAALGDDPRLIALFGEVTKRGASQAADVTFNNNVFFDPDDEKVREFIRKMGFELNEVCMADYLPRQLGSLQGDEAAYLAVRDVFKRMMFWELAVAEDADVEPVDPHLPFKVESEVRDGIFEASIQGRMDTITAPEVLEQFQNAGSGFKAIRLDVSRMSYISSAGLRVLVMMCKSLDNMAAFKMTGASKDVRKILESSGLDRLLLR